MMSHLVSDVLKKKVIGADGAEIGVLQNLIIDAQNGMVVDMVIKPEMDIDPSAYKRDEEGYILLPFDRVRAIKDCIVVE